MRRQTSALFAAVIAGALVLSGCGSDDPPAAPSASAGGASPSLEAPASSGAAGSEAAGSDAAGSETAGSDDAESEAAGTSEAKSEEGSEPMSSESDSEDSAGSESAASEDSGVAGSGATSGDDSSGDDSASEGSAGEGTDDDQAGGDESSVAPIDLDETTTEWFGTMCSGFGPALTQDADLDFDDSKPFEAERDRVAGLYQEVGTTLSEAAAQLSELPAPSIEGGDRLAPAVIEGFSAMGSEAQKQGASLGAISDPAEFKTAAEAADDAMDKVSEGFGDGVDEVMEAPGVQEAIVEIPECALLAGS